MTIWKFPITPHGTVNMPEGAEILSVQAQMDVTCLWALVDQSAPLEERHFLVAPTGADLPADAGAFLGTVQVMGGMLVFHVFEVTR